MLKMLINYKDAILMVQLTFEYCLYYPLNEHCKLYKVSWQNTCAVAAAAVTVAFQTIFIWYEKKCETYS